MRCTDSNKFWNTATNKCTECLTNCDSCINADTCTECKDKFDVVKDAGGVTTCQPCQTGTYFDSSKDTGKKCETCLPDCAECDEEKVCKVCEDSFETYDAGAGVTGCRVCEKHKFWDGTGDKTCKECDKNCKTCADSAVKCQTCKDNASLQTSDNTCKCNEGYNEDGNGDCQACSAECLQCDNPNTCTLCKDEFVLATVGSNKVCKSC